MGRLNWLSLSELELEATDSAKKSYGVGLGLQYSKLYDAVYIHRQIISSVNLESSPFRHFGAFNILCSLHLNRHHSKHGILLGPIETSFEKDTGHRRRLKHRSTRTCAGDSRQNRYKRNEQHRHISTYLYRS